MSVVDNRVVSMTFDNKQFESGVATSMSTLDKLKQKISMTEASKGFEELGKAADRLSFDTLNINIDGVTAKFSAFQSFIHGIFESLGNDVAQFGKRLVGSLTFDQVMSGWGKYGEMATSVASIIAATGDSQEAVYDKLNKLNWFSDATSYSLTQMTGAYSKFAAAGVDAESSLQAIMGLATAASRAGISASDSRFNSVLYNVSQAMGMGYLGTMDWKSLELASIATVEFKQKLIDVGVELGELKKEGDKVFTQKGTEVTAENLRESLSEKWLTKDVMLGGFGMYGGFVDEVYKYATEKGISAEQAMQELADTTDQFGYAAMRSAQETKTWAEAVDATKDAVSTLWMKIFQDVIGNYEEAKEVWGTVAGWLYDAFAVPLENVERLLSSWKKLGGRDELLQGLKTGFESFGEVLNVVKDAFSGLSPFLTEIFGLSSAVESISDAIPSPEELKGLKPIEEFTKVLGSEAEGPKTFGEKLVLLTRRFREFMESIKPTPETLEKIAKIFGGIASVIDLVKTIFSAAFSIIKSFFSEMSGGSVSVLDVAAAIGEWVSKTVEAIKTSEEFQNIIQKIKNVLAPVAHFLRDFFGNTLASFKSGGGGLTGVLQVIFDTLSNIGEVVVDIIEELTGWDLHGIFGTVKTVIQDVRDYVVDLVSKLTGNNDFSIWETLKNIFVGIKDAIGPVVEGVGSLFTKVVEGARNLASKINLENIISGLKSVWNWVKGAGAKVWEWIKGVGESLGKLDLGQLFGSVATGAGAVGIWAIFDKLKGVLGMFGKGCEAFGSKDGFKSFLGGIKDALVDFSNTLKQSISIGNIIKVAAAILILAIAVKTISDIPTTQLIMAVGAISILFTQVSSAISTLAAIKFADSNGLLKATLGIVAMSVGVLILASAMKKIASLSVEELVKGVVAIGVLLAELTLVTKFAKSNNLISTGVGLIAVAAAVAILASVAKTFADMSWEDLLKAGTAIGALLTALTGMTMLIGEVGQGSGMVKAGVGLIAVAAAIKILASAAKDFASMDWEDLGKAGSAITVLLAALMGFTIGVTKLGSPKGMISTGIGVIAIAAALKILASVAKDFASMDWESLGKAGAAITVLLAAVMGFSIGVSKLGGNLMAQGIGLLLVAAALKQLSTVAKVFGDMDWESLGKAGAAIVVLLAAIMGFSIGMQALAGGGLAGAASLLVIAAAMNVLIPPFLVFSKLKWEAIARGLSAMGGSLLIFLAAAAVAQIVWPGLLALAAAVTLLSVAFATLLPVFALFSAFSWDAIAKSLSVLGGTLLIFLGAALIAEAVAPGLFILAGAMLALGAAVALLGIGIGTLVSAISLGLAIGTAGIEAFLLNLVMIITTIIGMIPMIVAGIVGVVVGFVAALAAEIGTLVAAVVVIVKAIIDALIELVPPVIELIKVLLLGLIDMLVEITPPFFEFLNVFFEELMNSVALLLGELLPVIFAFLIDLLERLTDFVPRFVDFVVVAVQAIIAGLATLIPQVISLILQMMIDLLEAIAVKLPDLIQAGVDVVVAFMEGLGSAVPQLIDAGFKMIIDFIDGLATAIETNMEPLLDAVDHLIWAIIDAAVAVLTHAVANLKEAGQKLMDSGFMQGLKDKWDSIVTTVKNIVSDAKDAVTEKVSDWISAGKELIEKVATGIRKKLDDLKTNVKNVIDDAKTGITDKLSEWTSAGKDMIQGFIDGVKSKATAIWNAAVGVVQDAVQGVKSFLGINSPSKLFESFGVNTDQGYINGVEALADRVSGSTKSMAEGAVNAFTGVMDGAFDSDDFGDPVIRPVMDLSEIQNGRNRIDDMLAGNYGIDGNYMAASRIGAVSRYGYLNGSDSNTAGQSSNVSMGGVTIVINTSEGQDADEIAELVAYKLTHDITRENAVFA